MAHAPFLSSKSAPVIVKGFRLLPETLTLLLNIIHEELLHLEEDIIPRLNVRLSFRCLSFQWKYQFFVKPFLPQAEVKKYSAQIPADDSKLSKPFITMDMTLANILRKGLLSAQLLPDNSCGRTCLYTLYDLFEWISSSFYKFSFSFFFVFLHF